jgi:preprotein translocase subunit SecD
MSADYIDRLRHELLRAGASTQTERRSARVRRTLPRLAPVVAVGLVAVVIAAFALVLTSSLGSDDRPVEPAGGGIVYHVEPASAVEQTAQVLRERLAAAGVDGGVSVSGGATVTVDAPPDAVAALAVPGHVCIYDWEQSVLGPRGEPAPADPAVTGGADAGRSAALTRAEAVARAARQPGALVVRAEDGGGWFALAGEPALTNADIAGAQAGVDQTTGEPIVVADLSASGRAAFTQLTRELAHRGSERAAGGVDDLDARQHLAIVIDDQIVAAPFIDFNVAPDGIDGSDGAQISGNLTTGSARGLAAVIGTGPLPGTLSGP